MEQMLPTDKIKEIQEDIKVKSEKKIDPLSIPYTDQMGRTGIIRDVMAGGQSLEEVYNRGIKLASKIEVKWRKKRLMQIGMLDDLLAVVSLGIAYNRALENKLVELTEQKNEADTASESEPKPVVTDTK